MHLIYTSGNALLPPVDQVVMHSSLEWRSKILISLVKSNTVLPVALHRCEISLKAAMLLGCNDAVVGPANFLCAIYCMYNERFDLISFMISFQS